MRPTDRWAEDHGYVYRCPSCGEGLSDTPGPCSDRCARLELAEQTGEPEESAACAAGECNYCGSGWCACPHHARRR